METRYIDTVRLLLEIAPVVFEESDFALKGGTAISLFYNDMPRLSVDLDVVFTDYSLPRDEALSRIATSLGNIREHLQQYGLEVKAPSGAAEESKLFVRRGTAMVKVEVNHIFRGSVQMVQSMPLTERAQEHFKTEVIIPVLARADIYGSKLVAAMDRQHPRDLFDVLGLYRNSGLEPELVECFVCYLAGHNRPVHEVLFGNQHDIAPAFENEFIGMAFDEVELDALLETRSRLCAELPAALTDRQREFLVGLVEAAPDWSLMSCGHLSELPAIRWKIANLERLKTANPSKFADQSRLLREGFG